MQVFAQRFYPRFRHRTAHGTRTTRVRKTAQKTGELDHVLIALRKDLRGSLGWEDSELLENGYHTVVPGIGERGIYVIALSPEDAELAAKFGRVLEERRFFGSG